MGEDGLVGWVYATYLRLLSGRQGPGGFAGLLSLCRGLIRGPRTE
jgi:hypothetical protein